MSTPTTLLDHSDRRTLLRLTLALCLIVSGTVFATLASGFLTWRPPGSASAALLKHKPIKARLLARGSVLYRPGQGGTSGSGHSRPSGFSGGGGGGSGPKPPSRPALKQPPALSPPATIASDCSMDVTAELQAFFDSVPDGSLVRLKARGCYLVAKLRVTGKTNLTVDGNGATLKAAVFQGGGVTGWSNDTNLLIKNLAIVGADPSPGVYKPAFHANAGIWFHHVINGKVLNVTVKSVGGDFVYVGPTHPKAGPDFYPSRNVSIIGLKGSYAGRNGITFAYCEKGLLANSTLTMTGRPAVDLVDINWTWRADDITIEHNTFTHPGTGFVVMSGHGNNLVVRNNFVFGRGLWAKNKGVPGDPNHGFVFANNVSNAQASSPFIVLLYNVSGVDITGNTQPFPRPPNGGRVWVKMCDTSDVRVVNNHVTYAIPVRLKAGCSNTSWVQENNG